MAISLSNLKAVSAEAESQKSCGGFASDYSNYLLCLQVSI